MCKYCGKNATYLRIGYCISSGRSSTHGSFMAWYFVYECVKGGIFHTLFHSIHSSFPRHLFRSYPLLNTIFTHYPQLLITTTIYIK